MDEMLPSQVSLVRYLAAYTNTVLTDVSHQQYQPIVDLRGSVYAKNENKKHPDFKTFALPTIF